MSEIKDLDILKFLEGNLKKKDKEAIRTWAYESVENAQNLAFTQKIFKASGGLKLYNPVDADNEWAAFEEKMSSTDTSVSTDEQSTTLGSAAVATTVAAVSTTTSTPNDVDILNFLEGDLTGAQASQVDAWIHSGDQTRSREFRITKDILNESKNLGGYKNPDVTDEFSAFTQKIKAKSTDNVVTMTAPTATKQDVATPTYVEEQHEEKEFRIIPVWAKWAFGCHPFAPDTSLRLLLVFAIAVPSLVPASPSPCPFVFG